MFVDNIDTLIRNEQRNHPDIIDMLKPSISNKDITLVCTTNINPKLLITDYVFFKNFEKIFISEQTNEEIKKILLTAYPYLASNYGKKINIENEELSRIISKLIEITSDKNCFDKRNPSLALSILKKTIGVARSKDKKEITKDIFYEAIYTSDEIPTGQKTKVLELPKYYNL